MLALAIFLACLLFLLAWLHSLEAPQIRQPEHPDPRPGLWFCTHRASRRVPFQHSYIRLCPRDPKWRASRPELFTRTDSAGQAYFTLGAGPSQGKLKLEFNRLYDLRDPVSFEEQIPCKDLAEENARIQSLLESAALYQNALPFSTLPRLSGPGYNCNSIISSLALRASIPPPRFWRIFLLCVGVGRPVPDKYFRPS